MELLSKGSPTVHSQSLLRKLRMPINSTPTLKKCDPFLTGNSELDGLLEIYSDQATAMAIAEEMGLPEPILECPPLPDYLQWRY